MRSTRSFAAFSLALLAPLAIARAQTSDVERVMAIGKSDSRVMEHLDHLSNRIGPRLTGSDGFDNACAWTREQFEAFGLANARLEPWGEFPVGFNRGPASGRMLAPEKKELHFGTNSWTAGTKGTVSGPVVVAPANDEELALVRSKLAGAWVLVPAAARARRPAEMPVAGTPPARGVTTGADAPPAREAPGTNGTNGTNTGADANPGARAGERGGRDAPAAGADRAFRDRLEKVYGEAGVLGTIRSGNGELILTSGSSRIAFDKLPTRPAITLLAAEHKEIAERLKAGEEVRLEFDIRNWFEKGPITNYNVIAELPGTEKPDEVVIVGGHLDSWDGATGATDNGTGVATTMEAARLLVKAGARPKRTIRFMLWGGEEQGLLGSKAYVEKHKDEMKKVSAVLVHDGGTNYCGGITATPPMVKPFEAIFAPVMNLDPDLPFKVREVKGLSSGGSDHASFLSADVPGFFWSQRGRANYNYTHHTQFDNYEQAIPEYQQNSAIVIAVGALGIANLPDLLSRENLRAPSGGGGGRRLGVQLADDMTIEEVTEDGLASKAGLLAGDRIVRIGDVSVGDRDEMRTALQEGPAKNKVVVLRKGKEVEAAVEFSADSGPGGMLARRLGLRFGDGLVIDVVTPGSTADQSGVQAGDRITKVGETAVATPVELGQALLALQGEAQVTVTRDGKPVLVKVTLPERP